MDTVAVSRRDNGLVGSIATGWVAAMIIMTVSLFYVTSHAFESLSYVFWFFSGLIAAKRMQLTQSISPQGGSA
jgi:hypothetical protein